MAYLDFFSSFFFFFLIKNRDNALTRSFLRLMLTKLHVLEVGEHDLPEEGLSSRVEMFFSLKMT